MLSIKYLIPSYQCSGHSYIEYFTILHISSCEIKSTYYQWPLVKGDEPAGCPGETRVARKDDPNNIFNKALDFSRDTLENLREAITIMQLIILNVSCKKNYLNPDNPK